jgi:hypothetical protein
MPSLTCAFKKHCCCPWYPSRMYVVNSKKKNCALEKKKQKFVQPFEFTVFLCCTRNSHVSSELCTFKCLPGLLQVFLYQVLRCRNTVKILNSVFLLYRSFGSHGKYIKNTGKSCSRNSNLLYFYSIFTVFHPKTTIKSRPAQSLTRDPHHHTRVCVLFRVGRSNSNVQP